MKQPNILIVGRSQDTTNYEAALNQMEASYLTTLDSACFPHFDGLLLPGGGDIAPSLFGEPNKGSKNIDFELDNIQLQALDFFIQAGRPVLGICKGMQIINVGLGGTIIQDICDIPKVQLHTWENGDKVHLTRLAADCFLSYIYQTDSLLTNSAHHQAIGKLGRELRMIQWTDDGIPEGIVHTSLPLLGVQWHPERQFPKYQEKNKALADGRIIFSYFLDLCR